MSLKLQVNDLMLVFGVSVSMDAYRVYRASEPSAKVTSDPEETGNEAMKILFSGHLQLSFSWAYIYRHKTDNPTKMLTNYLD